MSKIFVHDGPGGDRLVPFRDQLVSVEEPKVNAWLEVLRTGSFADAERVLHELIRRDMWRLEGGALHMALPQRATQAKPGPKTKQCRIPARLEVVAPPTTGAWHARAVGAELVLCGVGPKPEYGRGWDSPGRVDNSVRVTCRWCGLRLIALEILDPATPHRGLVAMDAVPDSPSATAKPPARRAIGPRTKASAASGGGSGARAARVQPPEPTRAASDRDGEVVVRDTAVEPEGSLFVQNRSSNESRQASRHEHALVAQYQRYLERKGDRVGSKSIEIDGEKPLRIDLYNVTRRQLVEAKDEPSRAKIRMAAGQLLDYGRHVAFDARAVLLTHPPKRDLLEFLRGLEIHVIWRDGDGFSDSANGRFT